MHEKPVMNWNEMVLRGKARARPRVSGHAEVEHVGRSAEAEHRLRRSRTEQLPRGVEREQTVRSAEDFGRLLRERRRSQKLNQEDLALLVDTHRNRIAELEHGTTTGRIALLLRTLNEVGLELVVRPRNVDRSSQ